MTTQPPGDPRYGSPYQPDSSSPFPGGQPQYGQPQYGQPQYGDAQYGQQPQYGQPQYGQPYGGPPAERGRDGFAIAALIFGIIGGVLFAIIFAIVALVRIRSSGKKGKVMSIIALFLSVLWIIGGIAFIVFASTLVEDNTRSTSTAAPTGTDDADTFLPSDIRAGDCLNGVTGAGVVNQITAVGCTTPHESQAYAVFDLAAAAAYPGDTKVDADAEKGCVDRVGQTIGQGLNDGTYQVIYLSPREVQWAGGFHSVSCLVLKTDGSKLTAALPAT